MDFVTIPVSHLTPEANLLLARLRDHSPLLLRNPEQLAVFNAACRTAAEHLLPQQDEKR